MRCNTLILVVTSVYCGQTAGCIRIPLGTEVGLSLGDIVLDGTHLPSLKGAQSPIFGPCPLWPNGWMDYRCHLVWTMEVGLGPGDFVLDGDPALPPQKKKGHSPHPIFSSCLLWPNGWMDQDATLYGGRSRPR